MRPGLHSHNDDHADPAAFWFARMNGGEPTDPQDEIAFRNWLVEDAANLAAYRDCQRAWSLLALDAGEPEILSLRATALGPGEQGVNRRRALFGLTGGAIAAACGGVWMMTAASPARALISTGAGQRLTAPLPDGSEVTLAPLSRLRLAYAGNERAAVLEAGQAYFQILSNTERPMSVRVGESVVTTAGGRFQLTNLDDRPEAVVEQGWLRVARRRGDGSPVRLEAGQRGAVRDGEVAVAVADVESETAWRLGRLVVRDWPLRDVVAAFNRYSPDRLVLEDSAAGDTRVSGSFRYDGAREFAIGLATGFDLSVKRTADGVWRISSPEGTAKL